MELLTYLVQMVGKGPGVCMDFFAGSGTLGDAILRLAVNEGTQLSFILVQLPQPLKSDTKAAQAGYRTISDICVRRLERVCQILDHGHAGFKAFKLVDNSGPFNTDRNEEDVSCELLLKYGFELTAPTETRIIDGRDVTVLGAGVLIVCLAHNISLEVAHGVAALRAGIRH